MQQVLGAVSLNDHVDEMREYYRCFSAWVAQKRKQWTKHNVLPAAIYHDRLRQHKKTMKKEKEEKHLLESRDDETRLAISDNLLPWLVFGCHVLLDYSTDVKAVSQFMSRAGFQTLPDELISDILSWSTYPARLGMSDEEQRFCSNVFSLLESSDPGFFPYCKSGYIKQTWEVLYQHHLESPRLNSMLDEPGIVFFGLVRLEKNVYSVVYMDSMTQAVEFSDLITTYRDFRNPREFDRMSRDVSACICAYLAKYGHPRFMVLVNPLSNWLYYVLSRAVANIWIPTHTEFVAPVQKSNTETGCLVLQKVEPFLSVVAYVLDQRDISQIPPFKYLKSEDSSWKLTFATNIHWAQNPVFSHHPKILSEDSSPPKLIVATIPGLEMIESDSITFRMLKTKPPKRFDCGDCPLSSENQLENAHLFQDLLKRERQFSLSSGQAHANILIDTVSEQALTYLWELKEAEKGSAVGDDNDVFAILRHSKQAHKALNEDDLFWISHGVEINKKGVFGPADAFEGDRSELVDPSDSEARQFHLGGEKTQIKKEIKQEFKPELKKENESDDEGEVVLGEEESIINEDGEGVSIEVQEGSAVAETMTMDASSQKRIPRKAAEIAAAKVRSAYERYKIVRAGYIIDREALEEDDKEVLEAGDREGFEEDGKEEEDDKEVPDEDVKKRVLKSSSSSPAKKRRAEVGKTQPSKEVIAEEGEEVEDDGEEESKEVESKEHEKEEPEGEQVDLPQAEVVHEPEQEMVAEPEGEQMVETSSSTSSSILREKAEVEDEVNGVIISDSEDSGVGRERLQARLFGTPTPIPETPPPESPPADEPSSPPFVAADSIVVPEPTSPGLEEPQRIAISPTTPAAPISLVKNEPMSPPFVKHEPLSPEARISSSPDALAAYAHQFANLEISDACPVLRMIDEDVFNNPDAEYSAEPLRFAGTQYPDGKLGYSSDSDYLDDSMEGYSDIDFGPEHTERMKQAREQIQYTDADFQLSEDEEEWPLLQPGDLEKVYSILKRGCGD